MKAEPMMGARRLFLLAGAGALVAWLAACASAPPERFYRLVAMASPAAAGGNGPVIDVAAIALPELFDRPQMVTLGSGSRVEISERHRWAEPLKLAIGRVVAAQLSAALDAPFVQAYPQAAVGAAALRVSLQVQRFDAEPGVAVEDEILWTVRRLADGQTRAGRGSARVVVAEPGHAGLPAAHVAALASISRDIARAAAELSPSR